MTASTSLQVLLYETLRDDVDVKALVSGRVYDRVPASPTFPYISFGPFDYQSDDADCVIGGTYTVQIDVWSRAVGFPECRAICDVVKKALHYRDLNFGDASPDAVCDMYIETVRVIRDADGLTSHGIVNVAAIVEEG